MSASHTFADADADAGADAELPAAPLSASRTTLVFDCDGTLHDSLRVYAPGLRKVYARMAAAGLAPLRNLSDEEIGSWLGWSTEEMWASFAPDLSPEMRQKCACEVGRCMVWGIRNGDARLYPGVEELLGILRDRGFDLVFLSNCTIEYRDAQRSAFGFDRFFRSYYCSGAYPGLSKPQIFEHVRADAEGAHDREFIAIGDRFHDMELAQVHGLRSIGCLYGFGEPGELDMATATVEEPLQILDVLESWGF